jgi:hypothetical protein
VSYIFSYLVNNCSIARNVEDDNDQNSIDSYTEEQCANELFLFSQCNSTSADQRMDIDIDNQETNNQDGDERVFEL